MPHPSAVLAALVLGVGAVTACTSPPAPTRPAAPVEGPAAVPPDIAVDQECLEQRHGLSLLRADTRGSAVVVSWRDVPEPAGEAVYHVYRRPMGAAPGDWTPMDRLELGPRGQRRYVDTVPVGTAHYGLTVDNRCGEVPLCPDGPCLRVRYDPPPRPPALRRP
jgi:hypothetical protein